MKNKLQYLLYRSFDASLLPEEQKLLDQALASDNALREEKRTLESMRSMIGQNTEQSFKPFFSARVLQRIKGQSQEVEDFVTALIRAFRITAVTAATIFILLFAHNSYIQRDVSVDALLSMPQTNLEETWELDLPGENL